MLKILFVINTLVTIIVGIEWNLLPEGGHLKFLKMNCKGLIEIGINTLWLPANKLYMKVGE